MNKLLMVLVMFGVAGCSNKNIYDNIQLNNRNDCAKLPSSQYDKCIESASKSYDEYERERKESQRN